MKGQAIKPELQAFIDAARKYRGAADEAELRFMNYLLDGEQSRVWDGPYATFEECLRVTGICDPARFSKWRAASVKVSDVDADRIGCVDGVTLAARAPTKRKLAEVVQRMVDFREKNGSPVTTQSAKRILIDLGIRPAAPRLTTQCASKSADDLTSANLSLRDKLHEVTKENLELRRENAALKKRIAELESPPRKRAKAA